MYKGKEYKVKRKKKLLTLSIFDRKIKSVFELKGLDMITDLQVLNLSNNTISQIEGLESLSNLVKLNLSKNPIQTLKGLDTLSKLEELNLRNCKIEQIESFQNKEHLKVWIMGKNPIFKHLNKVISKKRKLERMTEEERNKIGVNPILWETIRNFHGNLRHDPPNSFLDTLDNIITL